MRDLILRIIGATMMAVFIYVEIGLAAAAVNYKGDKITGIKIVCIAVFFTVWAFAASWLLTR